jgi:hypothetical protein
VRAGAPTLPTTQQERSRNADDYVSCCGQQSCVRQPLALIVNTPPCPTCPTRFALADGTMGEEPIMTSGLVSPD